MQRFFEFKSLAKCGTAMRLFALAMMCMGAHHVWAQALVSGSGVVVSAQDMEFDLIRVPPEARAKTYGQPDAIKNNVSNIYVRRVLAADARREGVEQDPLVKAAIESAKDRILSDARLAQLDQSNQASMDALQSYAQTAYKTDPKRFEAPEQIKIRHILLRPIEPNARSEAEALLKEIKAGADFAELAKKRSQDQGSAAKGGDLGLVSKGRMVKAFEDAAFSLGQVGAVSEVIETNFGFHIIKLDERKPAGVRSFDEVKESLMKEAETKLINDGRKKEQERILSMATFDQAAIEAFAKVQAQVAK